MTGSPSPNAWPPLDHRRAGFDRMYAGHPERFAGPPSRFSTWALELLRAHVPAGRLLELGCGLGRDARRFAAEGYVVRATDYSRTAIERARAVPNTPPSLRFDAEDAVNALRSEADGSVDVVYAHALYMMVSDDELDTVFREVLRVLRPGGLHLFAARSVTDPVAGQGEEVAPDVWRRLPGRGETGPLAPYRFFRRESLDRWTGTGYERVAADLLPDIHFWFVADRRPGGAGPGVAGRAFLGAGASVRL